MRLLSVRLIVSLIVGITLVSLGFSYYEVLREKRGLRTHLERNSEELGESIALNLEKSWSPSGVTANGAALRNTRTPAWSRCLRPARKVDGHHP